jgi:hypothetical protein
MVQKAGPPGADSERAILWQSLLGQGDLVAKSGAASITAASVTCHDPNEVLGSSGDCWCKEGYKRDATMKCVPE